MSVMAIIRVCLLLFTMRAKDPKQGPKKGIHQRKITTSGFIFLYFNPTLIQLKGLMEFRATSIDKFCGLGSLESWVCPGNRKPGYCNEKVRIVTWFSLASSSAKRSLYVDNPPRSGCAGPTITMCLPVNFTLKGPLTVGGFGDVVLISLWIAARYQFA